MRLSALTGLFICSLLFAVTAHGAQGAAGGNQSSENQDVEIRVVDGGWGEATTPEVEALLHSVAHELMRHFPDRRLEPIIVSHSDATPMVLYQKGPNNEYLVRLVAKNKRWSEYVFEFAHELSHILSHFDRNGRPATTSPYQWFDEALCEAASLFVLKHVALTWERETPYPEWKAYVPVVRQYLEDSLREPHRRLPPNMTLAQWYRDNEKALAANPYLRAKNELVANALLTLFEENPDNWGAIDYLNPPGRQVPASFRDFLQNWYERADDRYKPLIGQAMAVFNIQGANAEIANASPHFSALSSGHLGADQGSATP